MRRRVKAVARRKGGEEEEEEELASPFLSAVKRERKASTVTVSERGLNSDPSVRCRPYSLPVVRLLFLSHRWGPTTSWGLSVGETRARGRVRGRVRGGPRGEETKKTWRGTEGVTSWPAGVPGP